MGELGIAIILVVIAGQLYFIKQILEKILDKIDSFRL